MTAIEYMDLPENLSHVAWIEYRGRRIINTACKHKPDDKLHICAYNDKRGLYELEAANA